MPLATLITPGQYLVSSRLVVNRLDGSMLVNVPSGAFEMGDEDYENSDCLKYRVELLDYWIGLGCVTNRQYEVYVNATKHRKPHTIADFGTPIWKMAATRQTRHHPVVKLSCGDTEEYAKWVGCQLPMEAQWEKTAKGPLGLKYPWGKDCNQDLCRNSKSRSSKSALKCKVKEYV